MIGVRTYFMHHADIAEIWMNLILTRQPSIKVLDSEKTSGNPSGTRR
jgi:hypothetical protein